VDYALKVSATITLCAVLHSASTFENESLETESWCKGNFAIPFYVLKASILFILFCFILVGFADVLAYEIGGLESILINVEKRYEIE
jgi:hypothetical protein